MRKFTADDLFSFANINLDHLTETVAGPGYVPLVCSTRITLSAPLHHLSVILSGGRPSEKRRHVVRLQFL